MRPLENLPSDVYGWELASGYDKNSPLICVIHSEEKSLTFWRPEYIGWALKSEKSISTMLSIWDVLCHKYILRTPKNTLIQLHGNSFLIQLECPLDIDLSAPLYLDVKAPIDCHLKEKCCLMCELHEIIYRPGALKAEEHKQRRLQECLIALDARLAGQSYREIAIKLWGQKRVLQDWQGGHGHLKELVRQRVRKGYYYMNGGYLDLLKK